MYARAPFRCVCVRQRLVTELLLLTRPVAQHCWSVKCARYGQRYIFGRFRFITRRTDKGFRRQNGVDGDGYVQKSDFTHLRRSVASLRSREYTYSRRLICRTYRDSRMHTRV